MACVLGMLVCASGATAQSARSAPRETAVAKLAEVLATLPSGAVSEVRTSWTDDGVLHYLGAPAGQAFAAPRRVADRPEVAATSFLADHAVLFGLRDDVGFRLRRMNPAAERRYLKLEQTVSGIPVFGGELVVQMSLDDGIEAVLGNVARGSSIPPAGAAAPALDATRAASSARAIAIGRGATAEFTASEPQLTWFVPAVMRESGENRLAWLLEVRDPNVPALNARWLLSATDGSLVREYSRHYEAIARRIHDMAGNAANNPPPIVREEVDPATGIPDADDTYDLLGDSYSFYQSRHGRDSFNGIGATIVSWVRVCVGGPTPACPWANASYFGNLIQVGAGFAEDDILAHEFTHGVTDYESDLIYSDESGAINESFSDIWGEYVDLANGRGNDADSVRWLIGENLAVGGAFRDMKNPPNYSHPDRRNSPLYFTGTADAGGVHTNSGVNNKLCFLLTDGGTFNGQTVGGLGIDNVARLYYEAQVNLLVASSGWSDLYAALLQSALNLGWNETSQNSVYFGCRAVEITGPGRALYANRFSPCPIQIGLSTCAFPYGPFLTIAGAIAASRPGDTVGVFAGPYPELLNNAKAVTIEAIGGTVTIGP
ncbi:MAG: hypothetical protein HOP12_13375 [Candidatus Eisenbacteria bacterium]|uniref:Neutral metalloproteinase n=1 Tax=Eiseniibacteriota bacterium TaxID=2212470 RepID=A0A849SMV7_UNCEI|nr:hypothetical protein [Candidatus Eisenbacteria bacterium]